MVCNSIRAALSWHEVISGDVVLQFVYGYNEEDDLVPKNGADFTGLIDASKANAEMYRLERGQQ
tara:strand:- start:8935 stop:9126 length:192 start_codon:yes stop_codon:yes gene_type:complete